MDSFPHICSSCSTLQVYYYASQAPCSEIAFHRGIDSSPSPSVGASLQERMEWIQNYIGMVAILGTQIWWTWQVEEPGMIQAYA